MLSAASKVVLHVGCGIRLESLPGIGATPMRIVVRVELSMVSAANRGASMELAIQPSVYFSESQTSDLAGLAANINPFLPPDVVGPIAFVVEGVSGAILARNPLISDAITSLAPLDEVIMPLLRTLLADPGLVLGAPARSRDPIRTVYTVPNAESALLGDRLTALLRRFDVPSVNPLFRSDPDGLHLEATLPETLAARLFDEPLARDAVFRTRLTPSTTWQPCGLLAELDTRRRSPAPTPPSQREVTFNVSLLCQGPATTIVAMRIRDEALQRLVATGAVSVVVTLTTASNETRPVRIPTRVGTGETVTITLTVRAATLVVAATTPSEVRLELVTDGGLHVLDFSDSLGALSAWAPLLVGDLDAPPAQALERWLRGQCGRVPDVNERFVLRPPLGANLVPASRLRMEGALRELPPVAGRFEAPRGEPPRFEDVVVAAGRAGPSILDLALRASHARASPRAA